MLEPLPRLRTVRHLRDGIVVDALLRERARLDLPPALRGIELTRRTRVGTDNRDRDRLLFSVLVDEVHRLVVETTDVNLDTLVLLRRQLLLCIEIESHFY